MLLDLMARVFICYRREDSSGHAGRLYDRLVERLGEDRVFMDIDAIPAGEDFAGYIHQTLSDCYACIVVIGRNWSLERLKDDRDFVKAEIIECLSRGVRVVPTLFDGARMPQAADLPEELRSFAQCQAYDFGSGREFRRRVAEFLEEIDAAVAEAKRREKARRRAQRRPERRWKLTLAGVAVAMAVVGAGGAWLLTRSDPVLEAATLLAAGSVESFHAREYEEAKRGLEVATRLLVREKRVFPTGDPYPAAFALIAAASGTDDEYSVVWAAVREASVTAPIAPVEAATETCRLEEVAPSELEACVEMLLAQTFTMLRQDPAPVDEDLARAVLRRMRLEREFLERALSRGEKLVPMIESELQAVRMPPLLHYLALIQSGYRTSAISPAKAAGLWQLMPATARAYGLNVGGQVDERKDPVKSTTATAAYLRDLAFEFGPDSLFLAIAAMNRGENGVRRALKKLTDPFAERSFWELRERDLLSEETSELVIRFLAAAVAGEGGLPSAEAFRAAGV